MAPDSVVFSLNKFTSPRLCSWYRLGQRGHHSFLPISLPSTRSYTVPDPPGLFDGHVWPMYQKYKQEMEANGVEVGKALSRMSEAWPWGDPEPRPSPWGPVGKPGSPSSSLTANPFCFGPRRLF